MQCRFVSTCFKAGVIAGSSQLLFPLGRQRKKSELRVFDENARIRACNRFDTARPSHGRTATMVLAQCKRKGNYLRLFWEAAFLSRSWLKITKRAIQNPQKEIRVLLIYAHRRGEADSLSPKSALTEEQSHFLTCLQNLRALFFGRFF